MRAKAKTIGTELIGAEAQLDGLFAYKDRRSSAEGVTARYIELRGYGQPQNQMLHEHH